MADRIVELYEYGQSVWLDYISRGLFGSGKLAKMIEAGHVYGMTSNPTIFHKAITGGEADYEDAIKHLAGTGVSGYEAFVAIGSEDIRSAADALRGVYDRSDGRDGFVSFEAQAGSSEAMYDEARRMWNTVGRPNMMIKIPGVAGGPKAVEDLTAAGVNVNITLLFDVDTYEGFANAYLAGLERRIAAGLPLARIASVASFFVSRVDTKVDEKLPADSPLRGKVAIANAYKAYALFQSIIASERWQKLAAAGARIQRPLWGSTGTKNPAYSDVLYVDELALPDTVNTLPEPTLDAFVHHGKIDPDLMAKVKTAQQTLDDAARSGIDLKAITSQLLEEGLASFEKDFEALLGTLEDAVKAPAGKTPVPEALSTLSDKVKARLSELDTQGIGRRIWAADDASVWSNDPTEITQPNRLGWLTVGDEMRAQVDDLQRFAAEVRADGLTRAVVLGMGGSSLAPEVFSEVFGHGEGGLRLSVLDTTVPADIIALEQQIDLKQTLFIVSSKSGTTVETTSHMAYFWEKLKDGKHFVAITDPGTPLEAAAREKGFRRVFQAPASIGGRYSALSVFGLVPAVLAGVDIGALLERASVMAQACSADHAAAENPGLRLGAIIGEASVNGQDKLTLVLPPRLASLGTWLEQLLAESTGKLGKGIVPIDGEQLGEPQQYGADRIFVAYDDEEKLDALVAAGHPVVRLKMDDPLELGAEFFRWEMAVAVAGHVIGINPFDQPNVQQAKDATARILGGGSSETKATFALSDLRQQVRSGDYIALQAYLPRDLGIRARLVDARQRLRDRLGVATTIGYGPRYLHSTGQVHKGGPNSGIFLQLVDSVKNDLPIPGRDFSFGRLMHAQADGDMTALNEAGRRVMRLSLTELEEAIR